MLECWRSHLCLRIADKVDDGAIVLDVVDHGAMIHAQVHSCREREREREDMHAVEGIGLSATLS